MKLDSSQQKVVSLALRELKYVRKTAVVIVVGAAFMFFMGWYWDSLSISNVFLIFAFTAAPLAGLLFRVYRLLSESTLLIQQLISADSQALAQQISGRLGERDPDGLR